jgi:S1-C subfamily serine protease
VAWRTIDRETAQYNGLGDTAGVMVWQIDRGSSAYRSGLRPRDLVVAMNGQKTPDQDHLGRLVIGSPIGSTAKFDIVRNGRHTTIDVQIVAR